MCEQSTGSAACNALHIRYPTSAQISQMTLASELQLQQLPLSPVSPGVYQLQLQLQPQGVMVLAFSCDKARD